METQHRGSGEFFDGFASTFDTFYDGKRNVALRWFDRRFRRDIFDRFDKTFELFGDLRGKTVLDIGCGSGPYAAEALRRGAKGVTCLDPAAGMLELARKRVEALGAGSRVNYLQGYFPQTATGIHDVAIVMGVMDYVADPVAFLKVLRGTVSRGAAVSFPSEHWFRGPVRKVRYAARNVDLWLYSRERLEKTLRESGAINSDIHKIPGAGLDYVVWIRP